MNHPPTDPIRLLLEAAEKLTAMGIKPVDGIPNGVVETFELLCLKTVPALTALVNEREKVRALVAEIRSKADQTTSQQFKLRIAYEWCANRLAAILDPQSVKDSDRLDIPAFLRRGDD